MHIGLPIYNLLVIRVTDLQLKIQPGNEKPQTIDYCLVFIASFRPPNVASSLRLDCVFAKITWAFCVIVIVLLFVTVT